MVCSFCKKEECRIKKKTWVSIGILAAGVLALGSWFLGYSALCGEGNPSLSQSVMADSSGDDEDRRANARMGISQWVTCILRILLLLPVSLLLKVVGFLLRRTADAVLLPLLRFLGGWAFCFFVLLSLFCILYKLLFPERSLQGFLRWKNIRWFLAVSFLLPGADAALRYWCESYRYLRAGVMTLLLASAVLFLWIRCFGSVLGASARLRALFVRRGGWVLPVVLVLASAGYGFAGANVSHETLRQNLIDAVWFYAVAAGSVTAIGAHRLQKRKLRAAGNGVGLAA